MLKYKISKAAEVLGVTRQTIYARIKDNRPDGLKHEITTLNGQRVITEKGIDLIRADMETQESAPAPHIEQEQDKTYNDTCEALKAHIETLEDTIETLKDQMRQKDTQIDTLGARLADVTKALHQLNSLQAMDKAKSLTDGSVTEDQKEGVWKRFKKIFKRD